MASDYPATPTVAPMQVDNLNVGVNVVGEGHPVLLLHGWGAEIASFYPVALRLAGQGYACHTLDLPGFGSSEMPPEAWDVSRYMAFVLSYLDAAELGGVHLIGHSFGGRIGIMLSAEHPERVHKLVLVNSAGVKLPPSPWMRYYYLARTVIFGILKLPVVNRLEPPVREWFFRRYASDDLKNARARGIESTFRRVIEQDLTPYARRIQAPTLLVWGDRDLDTPLRSAKILESIIPDAGLVIFDGAGHYSYLDSLTEFVRIVTAFFRGD